MFGRLTTLFNSSEDSFTKTQRQFIEQWNNLTLFLSHHTVTDLTDVYDTKISVYVAEMIYMIENDKIPPDSDYGPCVEFILQNDVLATLQLHAQNDIPTGMRRLVLNLFSQLIQKLERTVIPHLKVHRPIQDMICICGSGKYPIDEINFITSILGKFNEDPSLVNLFMNETRAKNGILNYEMRLVDALISLSHSKDARVVIRSCESVLLCVSADSEHVIDSVLSYTILVQDLVSRLCQRYNYFQSDPCFITSTTVSWNQILLLEPSHDKATVRLLVWVDYLNTVTRSSHPSFNKQLLTHLSRVFLYTHLLNDLQSGQFMDVVKALTVSQKLLCCLSSELLLVEVLKFLTDDTVIPILCNLLNHENPRVVTNTLILFNNLLETHHSLVVETLILRYTRRNVNVRTAILLHKDEPSDSTSDEISSDDETSFIHLDTSIEVSENDHVIPSPDHVTSEDHAISSENEDDSPNFKTVIVPHDQRDRVRKSDKNNKINISLDKSVKHFMELMDGVTKPRISGFSEYLFDVHCKCEELKLGYSWIPDHYKDLEDIDDVTAGCGIFLDTLLDFTKTIPTQSYHVNMLLMSLLSEIAYIPHYSVAVMLLDTSLPSPNLYSNLKLVSSELSKTLQEDPNLSQIIQTAPENELSDFCKAVLLTEEFSKEIAAIALVKSSGLN